MSVFRVLVLVAAVAAPLSAAPPSTTYVGVVTDTMCNTSHRAMKITPDARCVRECVGDGTTYKYGLAVGKNVYLLSDQETPAKFAGEKVKVTGALYTKTNILKVDSIAPLR